ncbi:winged helix-turn-helix transcriptional regulator [Dyadobacter subterraneus]|uniref:Helix-turn-helix transcriptional regulator n=1 Tax=Dyadobacter subterraneus TaxID=2773304 RepID=A0ABR9WB43_9BACT|nr:helix-turn-helix domain-containing protein [Dyadobacter subterraneus]MBE9462705.1 helix-turn-helix transcriptional regulator [Dyadobacter subterraneus]
MKEIKPRSGCPLSYTLDFFGDKWSLLIMRDMVIGGKATYGEFLGSDEKIATNILADRLSMLETYGFVTKQVAPDKKSKFVYRLTEKGIGLVPVILEIGLWGSQFHPPGLGAELIDALHVDRTGTIQKIQDSLRSKLA